MLKSRDQQHWNAAIIFVAPDSKKKHEAFIQTEKGLLPEKNLYIEKFELNYVSTEALQRNFWKKVKIN